MTIFNELIKVFKTIKNKTKDNYNIEHHLSNNRYYPKLGRMYFIRNNISGKINLIEVSMYSYSIYANSKEEAMKYFAEYKKQIELEKIEIIEVE
jgi:adenine C2-methylase RlmN of 23S rRNA A2503 and tRNA A37